MWLDESITAIKDAWRVGLETFKNNKIVGTLTIGFWLVAALYVVYFWILNINYEGLIINSLALFGMGFYWIGYFFLPNIDFDIFIISIPTDYLDILNVRDWYLPFNGFALVASIVVVITALWYVAYYSKKRIGTYNAKELLGLTAAIVGLSLLYWYWNSYRYYYHGVEIGYAHNARTYQWTTALILEKKLTESENKVLLQELYDTNSGEFVLFKNGEEYYYQESKRNKDEYELTDFGERANFAPIQVGNDTYVLRYFYGNRPKLPVGITRAITLSIIPDVFKEWYFDEKLEKELEKKNEQLKNLEYERKDEILIQNLKKDISDIEKKLEDKKRNYNRSYLKAKIYQRSVNFWIPTIVFVFSLCVFGIRSTYNRYDKLQTAGLQNEIKEKDKSLLELQEEKKIKDKQLQEAKGKIELTDKQLKEANGKIEEKDKQLQEANRKIESTDKQLQEAKGKIELTDKQLQEANGKIELKDKQLKEANEEAELKDKLLQEQQNEYIKLNTNLGALVLRAYSHAILETKQIVAEGRNTLQELSNNCDEPMSDEDLKVLDDRLEMAAKKERHDLKNKWTADPVYQNSEVVQKYINKVLKGLEGIAEAISINMEDTSLNIIINEIEKHVAKYKDGPSGFVYAIDVPEREFFMKANLHHFCSIIDNLVGNAKEATQRHKNELRKQRIFGFKRSTCLNIYTTEEEDGMYLNIKVEDNGGGFKEVDKVYRAVITSSKLDSNGQPRLGEGTSYIRIFTEMMNGTVNGENIMVDGEIIGARTLVRFKLNKGENKNG